MRRQAHAPPPPTFIEQVYAKKRFGVLWRDLPMDRAVIRINNGTSLCTLVGVISTVLYSIPRAVVVRWAHLDHACSCQPSTLPHPSRSCTLPSDNSLHPPST